MLTKTFLLKSKIKHLYPLYTRTSSRAMTKPYIAVASAKAAPSIVTVVILSPASGCLAIDSVAFCVAKPMLIPAAAHGIDTAKTAARAINAPVFICSPPYSTISAM
jgi:hypothetical protein